MQVNKAETKRYIKKIGKGQVKTIQAVDSDIN